jgi:hypothetical protein
MPKENTHILFAAGLMNKLDNKELQSLLKDNCPEYYFGSIFPDTFYYSKREDVIRLSEMLHGKDGNLTNEYIFIFLEHIMAVRRKNELAFLIGYITHYFLDINFHPVIYYLSGNYYDKDDKKRLRAVYLHRHLETYLDVRVHNQFSINTELNKFRLIDISCLNKLPGAHSLSLNGFQAVLDRQIQFNAFFRNKLVYYIVRLLANSSLFDRSDIPLFYQNLKHEKKILPEGIFYRDLITGAPLETTVTDLYRNSLTKAAKAIESLYSYYLGQSDIVNLKTHIRGESLNTGALKCPVDQIRFTDET